MISRSKMTVVATAVLIVAFSSGLSPANAVALAGPVGTAASDVVVGPNGDVYAPPKAAGVHPLLDPGTIALCNAGFGNVSVASWNNNSIGHIDLFCGDNSSGYVHIRSGHQSDWQAILNSYPIGGNWDDLMVFATGQAITSGPYYNEGSNKYCYTAPLQIKHNGTVVATYNPTILVSVNNKRVITSYPTHYSSAC